ncbi:MAG TPA: response regulator transcription factor [Acidimicrobiales bacterium]|nr:response regulator transcription factor [Acidimicrobiales bacterium]
MTDDSSEDEGDATTGPVSVVLVDDQDLMRSGLRTLVDSDPALEVVGEAGTGVEALDVIRHQRPDVVLMDIRMPVMDGIEATRRIAADEHLAGTHVVVLTTFERDEYIHDALRAGASGFLLKDTQPAALLDAIKVVARGDALLSPQVTRRLIEDYASRPEPAVAVPDEMDMLTPREREVLGLVARGLSNDEIAGELFVSPLTAKTHVSRILYKLHARDRAQLVMLAYESGMVVPGS